MNNENRKILIFGIVIVLLIMVVPIVAIMSGSKSEKELEKFKNYVNKDELRFLYLGREDCGYCVAFHPELDFISDEYGVDYLYVDTNNLNDKDLSTILEVLEINPEDFGTPTLAIVQNSKVVIVQSGFLTDNELFKFLQDNKVIDSSEKLVFNYVDYEGYTSLIASKTNQLIAIGQIGQESTKQASKALVSLAKEYNLTINYLNGSLLTEEEGIAFEESLEFFKDSSNIATPLFMIVKDGKVVDAIIGEISEEVYLDFLLENNIVKE